MNSPSLLLGTWKSQNLVPAGCSESHKPWAQTCGRNWRMTSSESSLMDPVRAQQMVPVRAQQMDPARAQQMEDSQALAHPASHTPGSGSQPGRSCDHGTGRRTSRWTAPARGRWNPPGAPPPPPARGSPPATAPAPPIHFPVAVKHRNRISAGTLSANDKTCGGASRRSATGGPRRRHLRPKPSFNNALSGTTPVLRSQPLNNRHKRPLPYTLRSTATMESLTSSTIRSLVARGRGSAGIMRGSTGQRSPPTCRCLRRHSAPSNPNPETPRGAACCKQSHAPRTLPQPCMSAQRPLCRVRHYTKRGWRLGANHAEE